MEYSFTLKYQLADEAGADELVERLGAAGCDDALVGTGQPGRVALAFVREAASAEAALLSALENVRQALPAARLVEATPDLVGLSDVAEIVGVTRQNMRKLMLGHATGFPAPVHEGSASVWHLADVLAWLQGRGTYAIDASMLAVARATQQVNLNKEIEATRGKSGVRKDMRGLFA